MNLNKVTGLKNMGNTCYLNAGLQLLFNCNIFNKLILKNDYSNNFLKGYKQTLEDYFNKNNDSLGPRIIKNRLNQSYIQFNNNEQCDTSEFLVCFIELIEENLKLVSNCLYNDINNSKLLELLFDCKIKSHITCLESNEKFITKESDRLLSLPIPQKENVTLMDCFDEYLKIEELKDDNKYYNEKLKKLVNATKQIVITNYPRYLLIILKRFNSLEQKIDIDIDIDLNYNFSDYNYTLSGFVIQVGNLNYGHYISCINKNNTWYLCNDDDISIYDDITQIVKKSYILLYTK